MAEAARFFFQDPRPYEEKGANNSLPRRPPLALREVFRRLERLPDPSEAALNQFFEDLAQTGLKMVNLAQPVRVALTGKTASPGLFEIISILGGRRPCGGSSRPSALRKATALKFSGN